MWAAVVQLCMLQCQQLHDRREGWEGALTSLHAHNNSASWAGRHVRCSVRYQACTLRFRVASQLLAKATCLSALQPEEEDQPCSQANLYA
jgi:hypothetical protein